MVKLLLNYSYDADADVPGGKTDVKPQLSKEQSRQVNQQMIPAMWFFLLGVHESPAFLFDSLNTKCSRLRQFSS